MDQLFLASFSLIAEFLSEQIDQLFLASLSLSAAFLSQQVKDSMKRYACFFGLSAQPFWYYTSYLNEQWGIFIMCFVFTGIWALGLYNYWIRS